MTITVTHAFVSTVPDDPSVPQEVRPSNWNAAHVVTGGGGLLQSVTIDLTAAQIRALNSSPVLLVGEQGLGTVIVPNYFVIEMKYGLVPFQAGEGAELKFRFIGSSTVASVGNPFAGLTVSSICLDNTDFGTGSGIPLSDVENNGLELIDTSDDYIAGAILTSSLGSGGTGYSPGDTGSINVNSADATYSVLTVGGSGAVLTYSLTAPGTVYVVQSDAATQITTGGGDGAFTININSVAQGDGTGRVVLYYTVASLLP